MFCVLYNCVKAKRQREKEREREGVKQQIVQSRNRSGSFKHRPRRERTGRTCFTTTSIKLKFAKQNFSNIFINAIYLCHFFLWTVS